MDDTADTGACEVVAGGGAGGGQPPPGCEEAPPPSPPGEGVAGAGVVRGTGMFASCSTAVAEPSGSLLFLAVLVWLRRRGVGLLWAALVVVSLPSTSQAGTDAQRHHQGEGGPWAALQPGDLGSPWGFSTTVGSSLANDPVVFWSGGESYPLLESVHTLTVAASARLGEGVQLGGALPVHTAIHFDGEALSGSQVGDARIWAAIPLNDPDSEGGTRLSWKVGLNLATGNSELYLGSGVGSVVGSLAAERELEGGIVGALNLGYRLQALQELPGLPWANQIEYGAGVRGPISGTVSGTAELFGSINHGFYRSPSSWPLEALGSLELALPVAHTSVRVGAGTGLTYGLGTPRFRLLTSLQRYERDWPDTDGDGIVNARDACPQRPEDRDGFRDQDGCPDLDNDHDTILDEVDECPNAPEVFNQLEDEDGCPDLVRLVEVRVSSEDPARLEVASVRLDKARPQEVFAEEVLLLRAPSSMITLAIEAAGHHPWEDEVVLTGERTELEIILAPRYLSDLSLVITDPDDVPLNGWVSAEGALYDVPLEGKLIHALDSGTQEIRVGAPGFETRVLPVDLPRDGLLELHVDLAPAVVTLTRRAIELTEQVHFDLDSARVSDESLPLLEAVAALLASNSAIELVRVEGHADERGDSRYNLDLSQRRAEAVVQRLVELGVDANRLIALGSGEARSAGLKATRSVEFIVLIWDDEHAPPELRDSRRE